VLNVTVIEYADRILPTEDADISKEMQAQLAKKGITMITGAKVLPDTLEKGDAVSIQAEKDGEKQPIPLRKCSYRSEGRQILKVSVWKTRISRWKTALS
jgi:dihydrolipoamide dehydrogenase